MSRTLDGDVRLAELDEELELELGRDQQRHGAAAAPWDDQATRLRQLVLASQAGAEVVAVEESQPVEALKSELRRAEAPPTPQHLQSRRASVICVASGKGGVGKSSLAVNLSIGLAQLGVRTTLLDADLGTANADLLCGITPHARLEHVITPLPTQDGARRTLSEIAIPAPGGFRLVPGSAGIARMADLSVHEQHRLVAALDQLEREADVLVIDAAAGIGRTVTTFAEGADVCLIVTTPEPTAIADAYALVKCLVSRRAEQALESAQGAIPRLALVVNQTTHDDEGLTVYARFRAACERFLGVQIELAATIAQDLRVAEAVRARKPLLLRSPSSTAARNMQFLAERLTQQMALATSPKGPNQPSGLVNRLARLLRR